MSLSPAEEIRLYWPHAINGSIVIPLSTGHKLPYLPDCVGSADAGVAVDITDPASYDTWEDACLCWNVMNQTHVFVNPRNLKSGELKHLTDGYIPFDHATGQLKAVVSLLKFAQDKLYGKTYLEVSVKAAD